MKKREFQTLVKNLRKDVKENIEKALQENGEKMREVSDRLDEALRKAFMQRLSKMTTEELFERGEVYIYRTITRKGLYLSTVEIRIDQEDFPEVFKEVYSGEIGKLVDEYAELIKRRDRLVELKFHQRRLIDTWKLRAIENGTFNREPFPAVLYEFVSKDLRQLITVEEPENSPVTEAVSEVMPDIKKLPKVV